MRALLTALIVMVLPVSASADKAMYYQDEDKLIFKLVNGVYILWAGEMDPITVTASRPDPKWPGTYVRSNGKYYWNNGANWHKYAIDEDGEGDWEDMDDPTIMVQAGGELATGSFLGDDTNHYVLAECEINIIKWDGIGIGNGSGDIGFSGDGNSPTITMHPQTASQGRTYALSYQVTGSVGEVWDRVTFAQNDLYVLRQEYKDHEGTKSCPADSEFDKSEPAYQSGKWGLLNTDDYHGHHEDRILDFVNTKARAIDAAYSGTPFYTAGYACPGDSDHLNNSKHIYGKAIDFDMGSDTSEVASKKNYDVLKAGMTTGAKRGFLYDDRDKEFSSTVIPKYPKKPPGFSGKFYTHGHFEW